MWFPAWPPFATATARPPRSPSPPSPLPSRLRGACRWRLLLTLLLSTGGYVAWLTWSSVCRELQRARRVRHDQAKLQVTQGSSTGPGPGPEPEQAKAGRPWTDGHEVESHPGLWGAQATGAAGPSLSQPAPAGRVPHAGARGCGAPGGMGMGMGVGVGVGGVGAAVSSGATRAFQGGSSAWPSHAREEEAEGERSRSTSNAVLAGSPEQVKAGEAGQLGAGSIWDD